jgi:hypothetical protein
MSDNKKEEKASALSKTLIYKLHGDKKPDSKFWKSEFDGIHRNIGRITSDESKSPRSFSGKKRFWITLFPILAVCVVASAITLIFQPNWFPFFKYLYKTKPIQLNIQPQPPIIQNNKKEISTSNPSSSDQTFTDSQVANATKQLLGEKAHQINSSNTKVKSTNTAVSHIWFIVELNNGEKIITQSATESNGIITAFANSGVIKTFKREDVKSVKKILL